LYAAGTPGAGCGGQWTYGLYGENNEQFGSATVVNGIRVEEPEYFVDRTIDVFEDGDLGIYVNKDDGTMYIDWLIHTTYDRHIRLDISRAYGTPDISLL